MPVSVVDGTVCSTDCKGTIPFLDAPDGRIEWTATTDAAEFGALAGDDDAIYAGDPALSGSGLLFALDCGTGDGLWWVDTWSIQFGDYTCVGINGNPAVVDEVVYVATVRDKVYAIRARSSVQSSVRMTGLEYSSTACAPPTPMRPPKNSRTPFERPFCM